MALLLGWVRPSAPIDMPALADEIARLSRENAHLRAQTTNTPTEITFQGLTFNELEELLTEKKLLEYILKNRTALLDNDGLHIGNESYSNELELLGLITQTRYSQCFKLNETGKIFINKCDLRTLRTEKYQPSKP